MPRKYIQEIIDFEIIKFLNSGFISVLKHCILNSLASLDAKEEIVHDINLIFKELLNPFEKYITEHLRFKGENQRRLRYNSAPSLEPTNVTGQFIPLRKVVISIFENGSIYSEMVSYKKK